MGKPEIANSSSYSSHAGSLAEGSMGAGWEDGSCDKLQVLALSMRHSYSQVQAVCASGRGWVCVAISSDVSKKCQTFAV